VAAAARARLASSGGVIYDFAGGTGE